MQLIYVVSMYGINVREKRNRVIEWIKTLKKKVKTLQQETHFDVDKENDLNNKSDYDALCIHRTTASRWGRRLHFCENNHPFMNKLINTMLMLTRYDYNLTIMKSQVSQTGH